MKRWAERHPFAAFYLLALAIGIAVIIARVGHEGAGLLFPTYLQWLEAQPIHSSLVTLAWFAVSENGWMTTVFLFAGAPTIAALLVSWWRGGAAEVKALLRRLRPWPDAASAPRAIRAYLLLLALFAAGVWAFLIMGRAWGDPAEVAAIGARIGGPGLLTVPLLAVALFLDEGGTLEELGWRGFAWPLLQERMSPLAAAILLGVLWWAWHFPREAANVARFGELAYWSGQGVFLLLCIALSIVIGWFVNLTGGSVLPAIMIHGGTNIWSKALAGPVYAHLQTDMRTWIVCAGAVLVVLFAGPRLGLARLPRAP